MHPLKNPMLGLPSFHPWVRPSSILSEGQQTATSGLVHTKSTSGVPNNYVSKGWTIASGVLPGSKRPDTMLATDAARPAETTVGATAKESSCHLICFVALAVVKGSLAKRLARNA